MKMLGRRGMIVAAVVTFLLATLSQIGIVMAGLSGGYIYYGSISRSGSLALGILLALFADRLPGLTRGQRGLLLAAGLTGWIASSAWLIDQPGPVDMRAVPGRLVASLGALAILYACLGSRSRLVRSDWVVRLGKISYGLYMLHFIGLLFMVTCSIRVGDGTAGDQSAGTGDDGPTCVGLVSLGRVALPALERSFRHRS